MKSYTLGFVLITATCLVSLAPGSNETGYIGTVDPHANSLTLSNTINVTTEGNSKLRVKQLSKRISVNGSVIKITYRDQDGKSIAVPLASDDSAAAKDVAVTREDTTLVRNGQPVPGGGTVNMYISQTTLDGRHKRIAFFALIDGARETQGIFVADASGLHVIATGCGGMGGVVEPGPPDCGTRSPIGGRFQGFFPEDAPTITEAGDVLFSADVQGNTRRRGLFLYQASDRKIVKVVASGDRSPFGGVIRSIGAATMNNDRAVVFLTANINALDRVDEVLLFRNGHLQGIARASTAAPGGGEFISFSGVGAEYKDGSWRSLDTPDINDRNTIAFWAALREPDRFSHGIYVWRDGEVKPYLTLGQPAVSDSRFIQLDMPILNNHDEIAFTGFVKYQSGKKDCGLFAGKAGAWRAAFLCTQKFQGGTLIEYARANTPMTPLDDSGNVLFWARVRNENQTIDEYVMVSRSDRRRVLLDHHHGDAYWFTPWQSLHDAGVATSHTGFGELESLNLLDARSAIAK